jgi:hypothetical protein
VLLSLADRAGEQHECRPSIGRLEKDTGLYRETIMEAIAELEERGLVAVSRSNGRGNRYVLVGVESRHDQSGKADRYEKADQSGKADSTSREKPTATSREKPTQNLPSEPTNEPVNKKRASRAADIPQLADIDSALLGDWLALRKQKRAPVTQTAVDGIEREAAKAGMSLQDALRMCCERGWVGFNAEWIVQRVHPGAGPPRMTRDEGRALAASTRLADFRNAVAADKGLTDERTLEAPAVARLVG